MLLAFRIGLIIIFVEGAGLQSSIQWLHVHCSLLQVPLILFFLIVGMNNCLQTCLLLYLCNLCLEYINNCLTCHDTQDFNNSLLEWYLYC